MGARGFFSIIAAFVVATSMLPARVQAACTTATLGASQTINGTLASSDCVDYNINGNIYFYDHFVFVGMAGQELTLAVSSAQIDPDLLLITPSGEMIYDDDGGGGTAARIAVALAETGTFQVIVSSAVPVQTGSYTFTFTLASSSGGGGATPTATAVEYFHAGFNHYFMTAYPAEATAIDGGSVQGWIRTGQTYTVHSESASGLSPVCRFFSTSFAPKSSHFYTPDAAECAAVKNNPNWKFEANAFNVREPAGGSCMNGTVPLYRVYNDGHSGAPNHRYTTCTSIRDNMLSHGWVTEGIAMCIPAGSGNCMVDASGGGTNYAAGPGNTYSVGPAGGTVNSGGLSLAFPVGALSTTTSLNIATSQPDVSFAPGIAVVSDAYQVNIAGDLRQPITVSIPAKVAPAPGALVHGAMIDNLFTDMDSPDGRKGVKLIEARYENGRYIATLPANIAGGTAKAKRLAAKATTSSRSFTFEFIVGMDMRSTDHFNIRFPARTCNSLVMDQWLQHAEEAYTRLVGTMYFETSGLGMPTTRMTIDVLDLGPNTWGSLSWHKWTLGLFNNYVLEFQLPTAKCSSPTAAEQRAMEVTIGHEFFHAIQNTYDPAHALLKAIWGERGKCLFEASSSWFEGEMLGSKYYMGPETTYASVYGRYFYQNGLGHGCATDARWYGYGMGTFLRFLTEKYGPDLMLVLWTNIRDGPGYGVPLDAMAKAGIRVGDEWKTFVQKLLLGTTGFGWQTPSADGTVAYKEGAPIRLSGSMYQLAARKYQIDFTSLNTSANKAPVCRLKVPTGLGQYNAVLYNETTKVVDIDVDIDPKFTPAASAKYFVILTNVQDTALVVDGIRYGQQAPFEVTIDCDAGGGSSVCGDNHSYEITIEGAPRMENFACTLSSTSGQTVRLCLSATNGNLKERSSTCYSNLQSVSGSVDANGNYSVDFRWGGYGASSLVDGAGASGSLVSGRLTGRFKDTACVIDGTVNGEFHAWMAPAVSSICPSGYDLRQKFTSPGKSN